jgi:hypothetical protein
VDGQATATSKSAILRRFVAQTRTALAELLSRDLSTLDIKVLMVDGEHMADRCCVVALAITADGTKVPFGLWDGATENKTVARALLADLVSRGLDATDGPLVVLDGAKALSAAVREVFGPNAAIQRCRLHKRRNVAKRVPDKEKDWVDAKLVSVFTHPRPGPGAAQRPAPGHPPGQGLSRRRRVAAGGPGGDVHRGPAGHRRPAGQDVGHVQPDRLDDLDRPDHEPQCHPLAGRGDGAAHLPKLSVPRHRVRSDRHRSSTRLGTPSDAVRVLTGAQSGATMRPNFSDTRSGKRK